IPGSGMYHHDGGSSPSDTDSGAISPKPRTARTLAPGGRPAPPPRPPAAPPPPPAREAAMTPRPVAPVIPSASRGLRRRGKPVAGEPMPLASPPGQPDVVYGFGRIDASGRVADRVTIAALGWRGGDRLTLTAENGVMIARRDPGGSVASLALVARAGLSPAALAGVPQQRPEGPTVPEYVPVVSAAVSAGTRR